MIISWDSFKTDESRGQREKKKQKKNPTHLNPSETDSIFTQVSRNRSSREHVITEGRARLI